MASVGVDLVNLLSVMAAGRRLIWTKIADPFAWTGADDDGITTDIGDGGALIAVLAIRGGSGIGESRIGRRTTITIGTLDLTATYSIALTVGGNALPPITYDADADGAANAEDVVDGIAAALAAVVVDAGGTAVAYAASGSGTRDAVDLLIPLPAGYGIAASATGSGALVLTADAKVSAIELIKFGGIGADRPDSGEWFHPEPVASSDVVVDFVPRARRFVIAGAARFGVRVTAIAMDGDGDVVARAPAVWIGLAGPEGRTA